MPVASKIAVKPKAAPTPATKEIDPWGDDGVRALVYGESGSGKTTFCSSFPGPILWLICSGGKKAGELRSVNTPEMRKKIKPVVIRESADIQRAFNDPKHGDCQTAVLDHVTGLQDLILKEVLGLDEIPATKNWGMARQQDYGQAATQTIEQLRAILNLAPNAVIIGQERTFGGKDDGLDPELTKPSIGVSVMPSVRRWLEPACDYIVQTFKRPRFETKTNNIAGKSVETRVRGKGVEYCLRCEPHDIYVTKFRMPLEEGRSVPDVIVNPTYAKFLAVLNGEE